MQTVVGSGNFYVSDEQDYFVASINQNWGKPIGNFTLIKYNIAGQKVVQTSPASDQYTGTGFFGSINSNTGFVLYKSLYLMLSGFNYDTLSLTDPMRIDIQYKLNYLYPYSVPMSYLFFSDGKNMVQYSITESGVPVYNAYDTGSLIDADETHVYFVYTTNAKSFYLNSISFT